MESSLFLTLIVAGTILLLLLYAYALFPIAIGVIGNLLRRRVAPAEFDLLTVTLIIPAYNEESVIEAKIRNSLEIDYPADRLGILVACDGVGDATAEIARRYESDRLRVIAFPERRGKASVVNDAVQIATGDLVLLCDANVMFAPDALNKMAAHFADPSVGAVSGDVRLRSEDCSFGLAEGLYYKLERGIHLGEARLGSMMGVDGGMYLIRRKLIQPLPPDTILDDFTMSMNVLRSGHDIVYEPDAIANENATELATSEFKRRIRMGSGVAQVLMRGGHPRWSQPIRTWLFVSHKLLRWLSPFMLICLIPLFAYAASIDSRFAIALLGGGLILGLAVLGAISESLRRIWIVSVPFYFVLSQIGIGYGLTKGMFVRQQAIWERTERTGHESLQNAGTDGS